jgi:adhesin HecA-like repeat protein
MQAFKVWWSYSWRASILVIPLWTIITAWSLIGLVSAVQNMQLSGQSLDNLNLAKLAGMLSGGFTLSILSLVLTGAIQVFAMRWTLNSRWSDFKLKAVPPDAEVASNPATRVLP